MNLAIKNASGKVSPPPEDCDFFLDGATCEVFDIMLGVKLRRVSEPDPPPLADLTALVGLAGPLCGIVSLRCKSSSACHMAAKMLGVDTIASDQFDQTAHDAIGEICNMLAGNFKAKLSDFVEGVELSVPTVITGSDYRLRLLADGSRTEVAFDFEGSTIWVALDLHS